MRLLITFVMVLALALGLLGAGANAAVSQHERPATRVATPIEHLVVIFDENISFDHYFGVYPRALNPPGEPRFTAAPDTPSINGLDNALLTDNPNLANPQRLDRSEALTCDQDHHYLDEQKAFDHGLMDRFVQDTSGHTCTDKTLVMDYFDGNTVTALWNYAQHFALSDNFFGTTFGTSTPGAINLVSGQTHGASPSELAGFVANGTLTYDPDPTYDACSSSDPQKLTSTTVALSGRNVGDLLNAKNITWGWFQGGFKPSSTPGGTIVCDTSHQNIGGVSYPDYSPHHEPFQYYQSTANPNHLPPSSVAMIGKTDQANHQYDLQDFWNAGLAGNMPAVSFLKAPQYQDGHAGNSDPLDEQHFIVDTLNRLQKLPTWKSTAVIIAYDDSDGWYDHVMGPIINYSDDPQNDALSGPGMCGIAHPDADQDRCGHGPRLPLLLISPYAKVNYVDHAILDQTSILRFIEDNWGLGQIGDDSFDAKAASMMNMFDFSGGHHAGKLFLDLSTGEPA
jgi:phospholipase C